jgi:hypothetical protein
VDRPLYLAISLALFFGLPTLFWLVGSGRFG